MGADFEQFSRGMPVAVGEIDGELKRLWDAGEGVATRASLVNLVLYSDGPGSLERNTELISRLVREHACRAIVIEGRPGGTGSRAEAWISAHCHMARTGEKQVCCEQISFVLHGDVRALIPNTVFAHLDSDLPLVLWWQGSFPGSIDSQLWRWVDRLLFDSVGWDDPGRQIGLLREIIRVTGSRLVPCDLNWTRVLHFRLALAQLFNHPAALRRIGGIERIAVTHAGSHRSTALLLVGFLALRLGWKPAGGTGGDGELEFSVGEGGRAVKLELNRTEGPPISRVRLEFGDGSLDVTRAVGSPHLGASLQVAGCGPIETVLPAGKDGPAELLGEELMRDGRHRVYPSVLRSIESWM
jgi:glucose-6-phosphate dehydrogenase assembly protein OpcA